jgi:hypothetical protein
VPEGFLIPYTVHGRYGPCKVYIVHPPPPPLPPHTRLLRPPSSQGHGPSGGWRGQQKTEFVPSGSVFGAGEPKLRDREWRLWRQEHCAGLPSLMNGTVDVTELELAFEARAWHS